MGALVVEVRSVHIEKMAGEISELKELKDFLTPFPFTIIGGGTGMDGFAQEVRFLRGF